MSDFQLRKPVVRLPQPFPVPRVSPKNMEVLQGGNIRTSTPFPPSPGLSRAKQRL